MNRLLNELQRNLLEGLVHSFLEQACGGCRPFVVIVVPTLEDVEGNVGNVMEVVYHGMDDDVPDEIFARLLEISAEEELTQ